MDGAMHLRETRFHSASSASTDAGSKKMNILRIINFFREAQRCRKIEESIETYYTILGVIGIYRAKFTTRMGFFCMEAADNMSKIP